MYCSLIPSWLVLTNLQNFPGLSSHGNKLTMHTVHQIVNLCFQKVGVGTDVFISLYFRTRPSTKLVIMCLCLGASGSGKTLLLRYLQHPEVVESESTSTTVSTVGSNLANVKVGKGRKEVEVEIRELGGAMAAIWPAYFSRTRTIIYVVDGADSTKSADAAMLLMQMLSHPHLKAAKVLVVLSKKDVASERSLHELRECLRLDRLEKELTPRLQVLEASACSGDGTEAILRWLDSIEGRFLRLARSVVPPP